jgi:hypothetical protein
MKVPGSSLPYGFLSGSPAASCSSELLRRLKPTGVRGALVGLLPAQHSGAGISSCGYRMSRWRIPATGHKGCKQQAGACRAAAVKATRHASVRAVHW